MDKLVFEKKNIKAKILSGIDFISNPVTSTLGPKGNNVLIEMDDGSHSLTNDGVTVAKSLHSKDKIENAVIQMVKEGSLRTNTEAGDATTTTVALIAVLTKEGLKLIEEGYSWIQVRDELNKMGEKLIAQIEKDKIVVKNDKGLKEVATTSANNDAEISKYVIDAISVAREEGLIFLEGSSKPGVTEVTKDLGFMVKSGIMYQELMGRGSQLMFKDAPVLITDKKLYYPEEAETILRTAVKAGHKNVVIVARDFMGEALNVLISNHVKGIIQVMLVKDPNITDANNPTLYDLGAYIGAKVFSEKSGSIVNKLTDKDFSIAAQVFSDPVKTLFTPRIVGGKELKDRIKDIKDELEKDKDDRELKARLASLTTGVVTIRVGAHTPLELREKVFRYEDAINATRSAMKHGYLPGGGTSLLRAFKVLNSSPQALQSFSPLYKKYCEAIVRQIAINCGKNADTIVETILSKSGSYGYNALTDTFEDLLKAGVVDSLQAVKMAILNSISVTNTIISINHYIINDENDKDKTKS